MEAKYDLTISFYGVGDALLHSAYLKNVPVGDGVFSAVVPVPAPSPFADASAVSLGITVEDDPELPRQPLSSVPYALSAGHAKSADVASDLQCSGCVGADEIADGSGSGLDADLLDGKDLSEVLDGVATEAKQDAILGALATAKAGLSTDISGVGAKVDAVGAQVGGVGTQVAGVATKVDALGGKADGVAAKLDATDAIVGTILDGQKAQTTLLGGLAGKSQLDAGLAALTTLVTNTQSAQSTALAGLATSAQSDAVLAAVQGATPPAYSQKCETGTAEEKSACLRDGRWHLVYSTAAGGAVAGGSKATPTSLAADGAEIRVASPTRGEVARALAMASSHTPANHPRVPPPQARPERGERGRGYGQVGAPVASRFTR